MPKLECSIIIPARNETTELAILLKRISQQNFYDFDCHIIVDSETDKSSRVVNSIRSIDERFNLIISSGSSNPAKAINLGISRSISTKIIVCMGDGSDNPDDIPALLQLLDQGVSVACASRYMLGGNQLGGKWLKMKLSKFAGSSFQYFTKVETCDLTNSFKGYSRDFIDSVGISAKYGFELGIEMVAKAHRTNKLIAEIPTIWVEKQQKKSRFKIARWAPVYIKWYLYGLGINFGEKKSSLFSRQRR